MIDPQAIEICKPSAMDNHSEHDDWQACPPGELSRMTARLESLQRAARFKQLFGTGLLSMFLCAVAVVLLGGFVFFQEPTLSGISCADCQIHAVDYYDYLMGKNPTLDANLVKKIRKHLKKCRGCRAKFHQSFPDAPKDPLARCQPCLKQCTSKLSAEAAPAEF